LVGVVEVVCAVFPPTIVAVSVSGEGLWELLLRLLSDVEVSEHGSSDDLSEIGERMCSCSLVLAWWKKRAAAAAGEMEMAEGGTAASSECELSDELPGRPSLELERSPSLVDERTDSSEPPLELVAMLSVLE